MKFHAMLMVAGLAVSPSGAAWAAGETLTCAQAYEKAQEEKTGGQLMAALKHLKSCIDPSCAQFIRADCVRWMDQTENALPTAVFSVREDGKDLTVVEILCDNQPLAGSLDGKAIPVDPGLHKFTFNVPGLAPIERQMLIREGERNRIINVEFSRRHSGVAPLSSSSSAKATLPSDPNLRSETRTIPYALAGVGVLGVAGFTVFGLLGNSQKGELERTCSPYCQPGQVDSLGTKYLLADTCLGVGLVSLGLATYLLVSGHGDGASDRALPTSVSFIPRASGAGGVLQLSTSY